MLNYQYIRSPCKKSKIFLLISEYADGQIPIQPAVSSAIEYY